MEIEPEGDVPMKNHSSSWHASNVTPYMPIDVVNACFEMVIYPSLPGSLPGPLPSFTSKYSSRDAPCIQATRPGRGKSKRKGNKYI